jgi:preprotein translocase subunit SecB
LINDKINLNSHLKISLEESSTESKLVLNSFYFNNLRFSRSDDVIDSIKLRMRAAREVDKMDDEKIKVTLSVHLSDEKGVMTVELTATGVFDISKITDVTPEKLEYIKDINTVSIMFPYIRSQISLLTTQPGIAPISLPPMNIESLLGK